MTDAVPNYIVELKENLTESMANAIPGLIKQVVKEEHEQTLKAIEMFHLAGVMLGGACDRGYCECPKIIDHLKEWWGIK